MAARLTACSSRRRAVRGCEPEHLCVRRRCAATELCLHLGCERAAARLHQLRTLPADDIPLTVTDAAAGLASNGEVEDYRIIDIQNLDASDAPGTTAAPVNVGGVLRSMRKRRMCSITPDLYRHGGAGSGSGFPRQGAAVGDDTTGVDDEEGASFTVGLGVSAQVTVTNGTGQEVFLYGYVDGQNSLNGVFGLNEGKEVRVPASGNNAACREFRPARGVLSAPSVGPQATSPASSQAISPFAGARGPPLDKEQPDYTV